MASSSSSHQQNQESNAFCGIEPEGKRRKVCESSNLFDVFINHRGPDVKLTLATELYNSLKGLGIRAFLDTEEKELGVSFPSTIETAIRSASVHVAIFSKKYAESAWCLAELVLMLQSNAKIIPVFYQVKPSDLRYIETGVYAEAFTKYEEKSRYLEKLNEWKEALQSLSLIAGEEVTSFSDCKSIIAAVQNEVHRKKCSYVIRHPVGLDTLVKDFEWRCLDGLVHDFENLCRLKKGKDKAKIVGIFGMGGVGKTTLAKELFNRKKSNYSRASLLFDVREASVRSELPSLQLKLVKDLFYDHPQSFTNAEEGTSYLQNKLGMSPLLSCLIVVDDIDHVEQLNALLVMDILDKIDNTLVIVTTRDVGVLITAGITVRYHLKGMNRNEGSQLFCWHAFGQPLPLSGYEALVDAYVDVCGGLPLSLQVLGRHVHGRADSYWRSELKKASKTLPQDVKKRLRISFDALEGEQKEVFMDIACFFLNKPKSIAERVWEGSGWNAQHALQTLKDKFLVEEIHIFNEDENYRHNEDENKMEIVFRMHDHLRDLGREMAVELSPPHRMWRPQDLKFYESRGFKGILAKTNVRCFHSIFDESIGSQVTFFLGQLDICGDTSASLQWLHLKGNSTEQPSIPSWICLQNLQCLKIKCGRLKTLWEDRITVLSLLKELLIFRSSLKEFPEFFGISDSLENVSLENGEKSSSGKAPMSSLEKLEIRAEIFLPKILITGIHYPSLKSIRFHGMENLMEVNLTRVNTLNCLDISNCEKLKRVTGISDLTSLVLFNISECPDLEFEYLCLREMECLQRITFDRNVKMKYIELDGCKNLERAEFGCEKLVQLSIRGCPEIGMLPDFRGPSCLERVVIDGCEKLGWLDFDGCLNLRSVSLNFELQHLSFRMCPELEELRNLSRLSRVEWIKIDSCEKLQNIAGIEELQTRDSIILHYCSNAIIRNFIQKLKSVPKFTCVIGRAVDGVESALNTSLFSDVDSVIQIGTARTYLKWDDDKWSNLRAFIGCYLVAVDSSTRIETINTSLMENRFQVREGEWIITMVAYNYVQHRKDHMRLVNILTEYRMVKKGFRVGLKRSEEWKIGRMLGTIVDRLCYL